MTYRLKPLKMRLQAVGVSRNGRASRIVPESDPRKNTDDREKSRGVALLFLPFFHCLQMNIEVHFLRLRNR